MPSFTITVTAAQGARVMNALCNNAGIDPPTQAGALDALRSHVTDVVHAYEKDQAVRAAVVAVIEPVLVVPT